VGSRVRLTAASCLVAGGLLIGGTGAALAFADPSRVSGDPGDSDVNQANDGGEAPQPDPPNAGPEGGTGPQVGNGRGGPAAGGENGNTGGPGPGAHKPAEFNTGEFAPGERDQEGYPPGEHHPRNPQGADPTDGEPTDGVDPSGTPGSGNPRPTDSATPSTTETCPEKRGQGCGCDGSGNSAGSNGEGGCGPGIPERPPWLPPWWPWPPPVGQPAPGPGGGAGGGGGAIEAPWGRPGGGVPGMQLPDELMPPAREPAEPGVLSSVPGVGVAAAVPPMAPITLPVIVAPSFGLGGGGGAPAAPAPRLPARPRRVAAEAPAGKPLPATAGGTVEVSNLSYRVGYGEFLRSAGISQVAALAVPGVTGILVLTGAGGLVGYRQAKAGLAVRSGSTARFVK